METPARWWELTSKGPWCTILHQKFGGGEGVNSFNEATSNDEGLNYNERRVINTNIYLSSKLILVMTAPMCNSPLVQFRAIPYEASLSVLSHFGVGIEAPCEEDRSSQVDGTGITTINM